LRNLPKILPKKPLFASCEGVVSVDGCCWAVPLAGGASACSGAAFALGTYSGATLVSGTGSWATDGAKASGDETTSAGIASRTEDAAASGRARVGVASAAAIGAVVLESSARSSSWMSFVATLEFSGLRWKKTSL
jgi:hypothetical protein